MAAITVYSAPEDGRKGRPKHVEHTCSFNKHNTARVASCWFIIYYKVMVFEKVTYQCASAIFVFLSISPVVPNLFSLAYPLATYFHKLYLSC